MNFAQPVRNANRSNFPGYQPVVTSVSLRVVDLLHAPAMRARIESAFAEVCNLVTDTGQRFSLVDERIGNGPLNVVLTPVQALCLLGPGDTIAGDGRRLHLGRAGWVDLSPAQPWNPCPDYARLATCPESAMTNIVRLRDTLPLEAPPSSLAAPPALATRGRLGNSRALAIAQARTGQLTTGLLAAYRHRNLAGIQAHTRQLAGLGPGLTPAGDDWLGGWLVGLRALAALTPDGKPGLPLPLVAVGRTVVDAAAGRTTGLSLAFLRAAADGAVPRPWHDFLCALGNPDPIPVQHAVQQILRHGATSGADMLAGFIAAFVQRLNS